MDDVEKLKKPLAVSDSSQPVKILMMKIGLLILSLISILGVWWAIKILSTIEGIAKKCSL